MVMINYDVENSCHPDTKIVISNEWLKNRKASKMMPFCNYFFKIVFSHLNFGTGYILPN